MLVERLLRVAGADPDRAAAGDQAIVRTAGGIASWE